MTESRETDYASRLLNMNPLEHASEILVLRKRFLHPQEHAAKTLDEYADASDRREQIVKNINALKSGFWSLPETTLQQQLEMMDISDFPELTLALSRLKNIAEHRESFLRLKQHPDFFEEFFDQFCKLVLASPREAADLRIAFFNEFLNRSNGASHHKPKAYYRIAQVIQREFPELYALENIWLSQIIAKQKKLKVFGQSEIVMATVAVLVMILAYFSIKHMLH
ncbi:MAG: hypothetical protein ABIK07_18810 [Planctomycetota bacterium]|uniref:hypothetical protein n=1 Tax=uncultured Gimesia sp. TaxID=1678688 RepID=UPI002611D9DA|nr:hypothetical protein [uncultured Gimesia sp.]